MIAVAFGDSSLESTLRLIVPRGPQLIWDQSFALCLSINVVTFFSVPLKRHPLKFLGNALVLGIERI